MPARTRTAKTSLAVALALLGSLGAASSASASDATVKAAWEAHDAQFHRLARQQAKAFAAWTNADHSSKTSKPVLRSLKAADKLEHLVNRNVKAESPSTPTGTQAKRYVVRSNTSYSHYLTTLERAVRLATDGKTTAANRQLKLAGGYAKRSAQQGSAATQLFEQLP